MGLMYNNIAFTYPKTETHVMGPGFDPSNSDQLYTVIRIKARALLNTALLPSTIVDAGSVANTLARIRHYLTQPRAPLYYDFTSQPGVTAATGYVISLPNGRDDANGPIPDQDAFSVVYTTPTSLEVTWACTVKLRDCGGGLTSLPLSLRWEDTVEFDKYWKATYRRTGTLIVSSLSMFTIDEARRNSLAPKVGPGFAREHASYTISKDGLRCDFSFVDGQMRYAPPYPAVDMDIYQEETFPLMGGMPKGQINVSMVGVINANPVDLERWCLTVAYVRLNASNPLSAKGKILGQAIFNTKETKDGVQASFSVSYKGTPPTQTEAGTQEAARLAAWKAMYEAGVLNTPPPPTAQGKRTDQVPIFPWVGFGTSGPSAANPGGFAAWANPTGQVGGPADGVLLAPAVRLFAALLQDPCGQSLSSAPSAKPVDRTMRTTPGNYNTPLGGQGGASQISTPQLSASLSTLNAAQYPSTQAILVSDCLYTWDGQPGSYDFWQCFNEYLGDPGVIVVPTSDPAGTNAAIEHSSKMSTLRKRWAASREGSPPALPPHDLADPNWVFTNEYLGIREMRLAPDGVSMVYEASGIYEYSAIDAALVKRKAELQPFLVGSAFEGPTGPARWVQNALNGLLEFAQGLSGGGGNPLGGGTMPGSP